MTITKIYQLVTLYILFQSNKQYNFNLLFIAFYTNKQHL